MLGLFAFLDNPLMLMFLGALAVLLFGERLPEVARSVGRGFMEFKRGMQGIQDEVRSAINTAVSTSPGPHETAAPYACEESGVEGTETLEEATAPKFEPPSGAAV